MENSNSIKMSGTRDQTGNGKPDSNDFGPRARAQNEPWQLRKSHVPRHRTIYTIFVYDRNSEQPNYVHFGAKSSMIALIVFLAMTHTIGME